MRVSGEIREKLVLVIGKLITRCIEAARGVPYVIPKDRVIEMVIQNPELFEQLVLEEHLAQTELSSSELTSKMDAIAEIGQFKSLDQFDISFSGPAESEADLEPAAESVNRLTRTFIVYVNNAVTIFEKEFELFMEKFRKSLRGAGMSVQTIDLSSEDLAGLERQAEPYAMAGEYVQAFSFDRLLNSRVMTKEFVQLPSSDYSLARFLIRRVRAEEVSFPELVKFILRACYVSQGGWEDLFAVLVNLVGQEPGLYERSLLIDLIDRDAFFACNLLCDSYSNIRSWTPAQRKAAIEQALQRWDQKAGA